MSLFMKSDRCGGGVIPGAWGPEMVPGGANAPELFMKPVDVAQDSILTGWLQLKADGISAGQYGTRIITGQGGPFNAARHCLPGLLRMQDRIGRPSMIVGEYVEEAGYDATMAAFKREQGTGIFWAYDVVPFDEWRANCALQEIEERLEILEDAVRHADSPFVGMLKAEPIMEPWRGLERVRELWGLGYEGGVFKRFRSRYARHRSYDWVRAKQLVTRDVLLIDVMHKGGRLAKIICRDPDPSVPREQGTITVPNGWNDAEAGELDKMMGLPPEFRWIEIAFNKKAGDARPRHVRFVRTRLAKKGA